MKCLWYLIITLVSCIQVGGENILEQLKRGKTVTLGNGVKVHVDKIFNSSSYFSSHALRIDFDGIGIGFAEAKGKDGINVNLYELVDGNSSQARGDKNVAQVFLPLMIGFKAAGAILTTLVAVVVVIVKSMMASKLALLLTGGVALKKLWDNDNHHHHHDDYHSLDHVPYYYQGYDYAEEHPTAPGDDTSWSSGSASASGPSQYEPSGPESSDSNISAQYAPATGAKLTSSNTTQTQQTTAIKRRVFMRKKPVVPLVTVHKITRHQLKLN